MNPLAKHVVATTVALAGAAVVAGALVVWSGRYDFAADEPHTSWVLSLIERARDRSITSHAAGIVVPDLGDPTRALQGAGNYDAMCAGCHLAPGAPESELSRGLYPAPPALAKEGIAPAEAFWVIKHGVKASGMPAWGKSMGDEDVWNLVAFLQQLPRLDAAKYREMVAQSSGHHHGHGGGEAHHDGSEHPESPHAGAMPGHAHAGHPDGISTHPHADRTPHLPTSLENR